MSYWIPLLGYVSHSPTEELEKEYVFHKRCASNCMRYRNSKPEENIEWMLRVNFHHQMARIVDKELNRRGH